jgi:hypothetical protein
MIAVPTTWGAVPEYSTVVDRYGVTMHLGRRLTGGPPGYVWHEHGQHAPRSVTTHAPAEPCVLLVPDETDAIVNVLRVFPDATVTSRTDEGTAS